MSAIKDFLPKHLLIKLEHRGGVRIQLCQIKSNCIEYKVDIVSYYKNDTNYKYYHSSTNYDLIDMIELDLEFITISESNYSYLHNLAVDEELEKFVEKAEFIIFCHDVTNVKRDVDSVIKRLQGDD